MDVLKDKSTKSYDYISRYTPFPYYYNTQDDKYVYGLVKNLDDEVEYVLHEVSQGDTLDYLSLKYYGRPDYFWIIADFNRIQDPFITLCGRFDSIKVPSINSVSYK